MEVKLEKRYPIDATPAQCWAVLRDVHAVAGCVPGAAITEQIDATHYKGTVKSKVGPAVMSFGGEIEVQALSAEQRSLQLMAKGADKAGSSASMQLHAQLLLGEGTGDTVLAGQATIIVSGKLAQFGSRLLVPVSEAMLAQFADNFRAAAAAVPMQAPAAATAAAAPDEAPRSAPPPAAPVRELNALALMWTVFKNWLAGLFGKRG